MSTKDPQIPQEPDGEKTSGLSRFSSVSPDSSQAPRAHSDVSLRQRAEAHFREREALASEKLDSLSPETLRTLLHELRMHQIELEMQNEELRRTQGELDASRARYFDLYDLAPVGYLTVSEKGLILEANLTAATLLGLARSALVKSPVSRFILKEDQDIYYKHRHQLIETGEPQQCELRFVKHDGTEIWAQLSSAVGQFSDGLPSCRMTLSDITGRKQAEEELSASHELFRALLGSIAVRIFWKDENLKYLGCNAAFAKDAGLDRQDEIVGRDDYTMPWQAQAELFRADDLSVIESGQERLLIEESQTTPSGEQIELLTSKVPLRDGSGKVIGVLGSYFDITERKRAEEEQKTLWKAIEQSANIIVITDPMGDIEYVNPAFEKVTGYTMAEVAGQNPRLLKSGENGVEFYRHLWETITAGDIWRGEFRNRRKDGSLYWESATISPVQNDRGEVRHFIAIKEDITERKLMEARLADALVRAEAAAAAKSEFLGVMSHELRTPLNGVLGFAELLASTPLNDEQQFFAKTIATSGEHLLAIVDDILDFSSMEHGSLTIQSAPLGVAELVESSDVAIRQFAADKGIEFRCEVAPEVPDQIIGDARRIRQILINLLGNALKFTQGGSVVLRIAPDAEGRILEFSVEDTGIGISPETLARLFQPFTQANSTSSRPFGGTGLGLAISKRLAEAMGGTLTATSTPDKGSTFTFRLPLDRSPEEGEILPLAEPGQGTPLPAEGGLVLVVDDEKTSATLAGKMLESLGFRAEFAADGAEAVRAFVPGNFFAILMDMAMPVMSGLEATGRIREAEPSGSRVPIIAFTANVMPGDREKCLAAGMDDFLAKPFKRAELAAMLAGIRGG